MFSIELKSSEGRHVFLPHSQYFFIPVFCFSCSKDNPFFLVYIIYPLVISVSRVLQIIMSVLPFYSISLFFHFFLYYDYKLLFILLPPNAHAVSSAVHSLLLSVYLFVAGLSLPCIHNNLIESPM